MFKTSLILIIASLLINTNKLVASKIYLDVRIYSNVNIKESNINIFSGKYELIDIETNTHIIDFYKKSEIEFISKDSIVEVYHNKTLLSKSKHFMLKGVGFLNTFEIEPTKPSFSKRIYDDNIIIKSKNNNLLLINDVELERYVAGVVEAEAGSCSDDIEFFHVQSIICRTYALASIKKHKDEGYHLCDDVHCQSYKGHCSKSHILMAATQTAGRVIVDNESQLISAVFHSNSGGQTMNSEDVWTIAVPYLRSVIDTFSITTKKAKWQKTISTNEWLNYLKTKHNYPIENPIKKEESLNFKQENRKVYFYENIHLKDIRIDLNLRSTFFSLSTKEDSVFFDGKGFGHGVGLSQEGAINMIKQGYTYRDVINFYYAGVDIISIDKLDFKIETYKH